MGDGYYENNCLFSLSVCVFVCVHTVCPSSDYAKADDGTYSKIKKKESIKQKQKAIILCADYTPATRSLKMFRKTLYQDLQ